MRSRTRFLSLATDMNFQPRHFDKNNKMLHFRARDDGIFEHKLLDILKNLLLIGFHVSNFP